jgi:hypothetical protein
VELVASSFTARGMIPGSDNPVRSNDENVMMHMYAVRSGTIGCAFSHNHRPLVP